MRTLDAERPGRALLVILGWFVAYVASLVALSHLGDALLPGDDPLHLDVSLLLAEVVGAGALGGRLAAVLDRIVERVSS